MGVKQNLSNCNNYESGHGTSLREKRSNLKLK